MRTLIIQADNKNGEIVQHHWANFIDALDETITEYASKIYFSGGTIITDLKQSFVWTVEYQDAKHQEFFTKMKSIQDSNKNSAIIFYECISRTAFI
jgi:cell division FtsZ-interacting protein ZapD